jgi:hypothetical protein
MDARPARPLPRRERSRLAVLAAIAHPRGASPSHTSEELPADFRYPADPLARIGRANELGKELKP